MADFCTLADLEAALGMNAADPVGAERAIADVSAAIRGYTGQRLELESNKVLTLTAMPYRETLVLPVAHLVAVASVVEDGTTLTVDDDYRVSDAGILYRVGRYWSSKYHGVVATVTCGYASDSDEWLYLKAIAVGAALRRYQNTLRSVAVGGAAGVQSEAMPDYQQTLAVDLGGAYSMLLLPSERELLDRRFSKGVG